MNNVQHAVPHVHNGCLFYYACEQCACISRLWNNRNGAAPPFIACTGCNGRMKLDPKSITYAPKHEPHMGQPVASKIDEKRMMEILRFNKSLGPDGQVPKDEKGELVLIPLEDIPELDVQQALEYAKDEANNYQIVINNGAPV